MALNSIAYIYTSVSVAALAICVHSTVAELVATGEHYGGSRKLTFAEALIFFCASKPNVVVLTNMGYNLIYICGRLLQLFVFGELTESEFRSVRERTLNYLLFKIVFMGAILNADVHELLVWTTWFAAMCFLRFFLIVSKERFPTILIATPLNGATPPGVFVLHLTMICWVSAANACLALVCWKFFRDAGASVLVLLLFENLVIEIDCIQIGLKYLLKYLLAARFNTFNLTSHQVTVVIRHIDFWSEVLTQVATLGHFVHVWKLYGVSFTLIDLFLFMNMRSVFVSLFQRVSSFTSYRRTVLEIHRRFPDATKAELKRSDKCAICLDTMFSAKRLQCSHLFHRDCIENWIRYKRICPCCRAPIMMAYQENEVSSLPRVSSERPQENKVTENYVGSGHGADLPTLQSRRNQGWGSRFPMLSLGFFRHRTNPNNNNVNYENIGDRNQNGGSSDDSIDSPVPGLLRGIIGLLGGFTWGADEDGFGRGDGGGRGDDLLEHVNLVSEIFPNVPNQVRIASSFSNYCHNVLSKAPQFICFVYEFLKFDDSCLFVLCIPTDAFSPPLLQVILQELALTRSMHRAIDNLLFWQSAEN